MIEIWKNIEGYEDLYKVSNLGNVKQIKFNRIIKKCLSNNGYLVVNLSKKNVSKSFLVHKLVAEAFIPNPDNLLYVNHKDENKQNNTVENLEWCTQNYNCNYGTRNEKISNKMSKQIILQYTLNNELINEFKSLREAYRKTNIPFQNISNCCKGKYKQCGGYIWKYKEVG